MLQIIAGVDAQPCVHARRIVHLELQADQWLFIGARIDQIPDDPRSGNGRAVARANVDGCPSRIAAQLDREVRGLGQRRVDAERKERELPTRTGHAGWRRAWNERERDDRTVAVEHAQVTEIGPNRALVHRIGQFHPQESMFARCRERLAKRDAARSLRALRESGMSAEAVRALALTS